MILKRLSEGGYMSHRVAVLFLASIDPQRNWRSYLYHNRAGQTEGPVIQFKRWRGEVFYRKVDLIDHWNKWQRISIPLGARFRNGMRQIATRVRAVLTDRRLTRELRAA